MTEMATLMPKRAAARRTPRVVMSTGAPGSWLSCWSLTDDNDGCNGELCEECGEKRGRCQSKKCIILCVLFGVLME